jgi:hypothetical protein
LSRGIYRKNDKIFQNHSAELVFVSGNEFPFSTTGSDFELCYETSQKITQKEEEEEEKLNNHSKYKVDIELDL